MRETIEIYIRNTGERTLLMLHVPETLKERLIEGIRRGSFSHEDTEIGFECSILDAWKTPDNPGHVRVSIDEITANYLRTDYE